MTDKVIELGMFLKRPLTDHLIITPDKYCSLNDNNLIEQLKSGLITRRGNEDQMYEDLLEAYNVIEKEQKANKKLQQEIEKLKKLLP